MSSSNAVVPLGRAPATAAYRPLRVVQSRARDAGSEARAAGELSRSRASAGSASRPIAVTSSAVLAWYSTSSAACRSTAMRLRASSALGSAWPTLKDTASISSIVAGAVSRMADREPVAPARSSKTSSPVIAWGSSGTVRITTDATKASVPSLPTTRCASTSTGRVWSRKEFRP
jgi:hypothetical protein